MAFRKGVFVVGARCSSDCARCHYSNIWHPCLVKATASLWFHPIFCSRTTVVLFTSSYRNADMHVTFGNRISISYLIDPWKAKRRKGYACYRILCACRWRITTRLATHTDHMQLAHYHRSLSTLYVAFAMRLWRSFAVSTFVWHSEGWPGMGTHATLGMHPNTHTNTRKKTSS